MNFELQELSNVLDVLIVSILLYAGLVWFKRTRAFLVVVGIVILGVVYALSRFLDLYLTTAILQGFFAVLLIAIIVIFQEELRHFFERVALWGLRRAPTREAVPLVQALVSTADRLARRMTGALIVVAGSDPLARHIEGGTELGGRPSEALLVSLFEKGTPAHDGAVIIEAGEVTRFAAHLPLSKELRKLSGRGTRHAAALGLAERCDALALVVSEERGTVSIARDGELWVMDSPAAVEEAVTAFFDEKFPRRRARRWSNFFRVNLREKLIAIIMAIGLWGIFAYRVGVVQRDFLVPIEYANLPAEMRIEKVQPRELTIVLAGEERAFRLFNPDELKATVDLSAAKEGRQRVPVKKEGVGRIPRNLSLDNFRPAEIEVVLKKNGSDRRDER